MFAAVRPLAVSGAVLVAASGIALAPIAPATAAVPVEHSAVALTAVPSPFELYPQVIGRTLQNTASLSAMYFADPFPITRVIVANQTAALSDAVTALVNGDTETAVAALVGAITAPRKISEGASRYIQDTYNQPYQDLLLAVVAVAPLVNGLAAAGVAIKDVIDAALAFDLIGLANAVVNIPARIVDGVLNGGYAESWPGLISPYDDDEVGPGPLAVAVHFDQGTAARIPRWSSDEIDSAGAEFAAVGESVVDEQSSAETIAIGSTSEAPARDDLDAVDETTRERRTEDTDSGAVTSAAERTTSAEERPRTSRKPETSGETPGHRARTDESED